MNGGANTAWCGRRDGGMIFNSNDLEVAPPHTRGVSRLKFRVLLSSITPLHEKRDGVSNKFDVQ
jgi:hypothetical protein